MATAIKRMRASESGVIVPFCAFEQKSDFVVCVIWLDRWRRLTAGSN
jgi:hypothetical protein